MKKRGEVDEEEEKDIYIGDEPDDGPTHYIMLGKGIDLLETIILPTLLSNRFPYLWIVGFSDVNLCSLLAEQGVEVVSIIQVTADQNQDSELEPAYPFWADLNTVFKRGLKKKQLIHTTRWQLTSFR